MKSIRASHESAGASNLRTINTALAQYANRCNTIGFPASLVSLGPGPDDCTGTGFLDNTLGVASPVKSNYVFTYTAGAAGASGAVTSYTITAVPDSPSSGKKYYFTSEDGVIHVNDSAAATVTSPAL